MRRDLPIIFLAVRLITACGGTDQSSGSSSGGAAGGGASATAGGGAGSPTVPTAGAGGGGAAGDANQAVSLAVNRIALGSQFGCAIAQDQTIQCWGSPATPSEAQAPAGSFSNIASMTDVSCAIGTAGSVSCWGNVAGAVATPVPAGLTASFLDIGVSEQCTVGATDRRITCWGGEDSKLGAAPAGTFQQVGVGLDFACGLDTSGKISCWGDDSFGQASAPTGTFVQLTTGKHHSCALATDGSAVCWGLGGATMATDGGTTGDTGDGTESPWGQSIAPANQKFEKLAVGLIHSCGISTAGDVTCWGAGTTDGDCSSVDNCGQAVAQTGPFVDIALGYTNTCGLLASGGIKCWGSNSNNRSTPPPTFR